MRSVVLREAVKLNKERKRRSSWHKAASIMAAVVVFCTTYALILPAITMDQDAVCGQEAHTHEESCYEQQMLYDLQCTLESTEGVIVLHSHSEVCYDAEGLLRCTLPEVLEHVHTESCTLEDAPCALTELRAHIHEENCYDSQGNLLCQLPVAIVHDHADCLVATEQYKTVLVCQIPEHIHEDACYPVEDEENAVSAGFLCGSGEHTHNENCLDEAGVLICTIPEHTHEAACLVEDLDLTADVETLQQWEETLAEVQLTGKWAEDILAVAATQLDYQESLKNCVLVDGELKGYTRYGQWYGDPYGDWDAMFVAFCLKYAEISEESIPYASDAARWAEALTEQGMFADTDTYTPAAGDLMFLDTDGDAEADFVGIVAELPEETEIRLIAGDTEKNSVAYLTIAPDAEEIIGYGILPENPMSQEQWLESEAVRDMVAALPEVHTVESALQTLTDAGDKAGYEALRQEVFSRIDAVRTAYAALNDMQKARVSGLERLAELEAVCGECWQDLPALTDDSALLTELTAAGAEVIRTSAEAAESAFTIHNQDVIHFRFTGAAESRYSDLRFGQARVKLELVLPLSEDKARFALDAMTWLEEAELTIETRNDITCQVLTGYLSMTGTEDNAIAIPGSFTATVPVEILQMNHGEMVQLTVSAAMEFSAWDTLCETHQVEEKLTVSTQTYTLEDPLPEEERSETFAAFLSEIEALNTADVSVDEKENQAMDLLDQVVAAYYEGLLTTAELAELGDALRYPLGYIAEYATGIHWMLGTGTTPVSRGTVLSKQTAALQTQALNMETYNAVFKDSSEQIDEEGGGNSSKDGAVYVSKTIEGTDAENVFDITLQVITQDVVNEVYNEPDMAVVVVMDISNTMITGKLDDISQYQAAMLVGEDFLYKFAENNSGVSKVGYIAFNSHGHKVFDIQPCDTAADAARLTSTMQTVTQSIMDKAAAAAEKGTYANSHDRFTNIQAGLAMAEEMLKQVNNEHKYVIFLSDGFPTTYMTSATNDGYAGYDPYCESGTRGADGTFYDSVMTELRSDNRTIYCNYGTSYSDTSAIKAREQAVKMKAAGINIFSIGVNVEGQTIKYYHDDSRDRLKTASTVERRESISYYNTNGYEIGTKHSEITDTNVTAAEEAKMAQDFKDWLKGSATTGIGSGYYYNSTDTEELQTAYDQIFETIKQMNAASSHLDWVAADPMGDMGLHDVDSVDFIGFYDRTGKLVESRGALVGESAEGAENTADFHTEANTDLNIQANTIHWNLKESGYTSVSIENVTQYMCVLRYRVRLKNEASVFEEGTIYDTNDKTTLTYRIIDVTDGVTTISERRTIDFPIPAVHGYLSELSFKKVSTNDTPLFGAEFTLHHDEEACALCTDPGMTCSGHGVPAVEIADMVATSDDAGLVTFTNIPSGHIYTLTETKVPDGYIDMGNTYQVMISYDTQTITVLDAKGNPLEWTGSIENDMYYELPNTGGMGTSSLTFGGALLFGVGLMYILCITGRKRRKEGR